VTAPTGAAVRDIINVSRRRNPYVQLVLYPAIVQGEAAAPDIVKGIQALERYGVDVIIAGRGGGSIEDLWAFNEEIVARAIFDCGVPVISAVGHETDVTIADFVADLRAPTPSAAAELAVFEYGRFSRDLDDSREALTALMRGRIDNARETLKSCRRSLSVLSPQARVRDLRLRSASYAQRLCMLMDTRLANGKSRVRPLEHALHTAMRERLTGAKHALLLRGERLNGLSPLTRLKAGYGYVTDARGRRIRSAADVQTGDRIGVFMTDGKIDATVTGRAEHDFRKEYGDHG
ncbi:MAG: exodeoxyribonuclease VII large subunit, partial [Lachnospiraceae bacterium]|nr:exodeoxyribonuclease VII large subunit [Lachnospiraceae bacterium]